jgi:RHS repeat-associated protein
MTGYIYDADGDRVAKGPINSWSCDPSVNGFTTQSNYVRDQAGNQLSEFTADSNGNIAWQHTNVYAGGGLMATYDNNGLHFHLNDWLGTRRVQTDYEGVVEQTCSSLPFGDTLACSGSTVAPTEHHFTGKERDTESGNDYFGARYYGSTMGRFLSPDPSGLTHADITNPQSFNLYSYVYNNPLINIDPSGMECVWDDGSYDASDDPDTAAVDAFGQHSNCANQGGTWVDPADFESVEGNAPGSWSGQANSSIAFDWLTVGGSVNGGSQTPLSGTFGIDDFGNLTQAQFISMLQRSGIQLSYPDTLLGFHPGLNFRGPQSHCSIHIILDPGAGMYGDASAGTFHIDEYNPLTFEPPQTGAPLDVNGGGMMPVSNVVPHLTEDVIPDLLIGAGKGTWTGNQNCNPSS